jgi:6-phosphogluconolactonase/glucosamine-6-phosphate isomerase/deaminase
MPGVIAVPCHVHDPAVLHGVVARRLAELLVRRLQVAPRASLALSGGRTPAPVFRTLAELEVPWAAIDVLQVDERVAPAGHAERNLVGIEATLGAAGARLHPLPVEDLLGDPDSPSGPPGPPWIAGGGRTATTGRHRTSTVDPVTRATATLHRVAPLGIDVVHLGLGDDAHTASLVPGDPALGIEQDGYTCTGLYQGRVRMTLTFTALGRAGAVLWLVTGESKGQALRSLLDGDASVPAGRVRRDRAEIWADAAAARAGGITSQPVA